MHIQYVTTGTTVVCWFSSSARGALFHVLSARLFLVFCRCYVVSGLAAAECTRTSFIWTRTHTHTRSDHYYNLNKHDSRATRVQAWYAAVCRQPPRAAERMANEAARWAPHKRTEYYSCILTTPSSAARMGRQYTHTHSRRPCRRWSWLNVHTAHQQQKKGLRVYANLAVAASVSAFTCTHKLCVCVLCTR